MSLIRRMAADMNAAAVNYQIGKLQLIRKELRGHKRLAGHSIFEDATTSDKWAFHYGGRTELQFNIGEDKFPDGTPALRIGVAFSLETGQSLTDWRVLAPRIRLFNEFLHQYGEKFSDLIMWHWLKSVRSADFAPQPITSDIVSKNSFIFLGGRQPFDRPDVPHALELFDRLLEIYRYVQAGEVEVPNTIDAVPNSPSEFLNLSSGVNSKRTGYITATFVERTINVQLRHNELQNRLNAQLSEAGYKTSMEMTFGQKRIDLVVVGQDFLWFYEVKTASTARQCIREAVGQLLEYAMWPGASRPSKLIVVGDAPVTRETQNYIAILNANFPVWLEYQRVVLD